MRITIPCRVSAKYLHPACCQPDTPESRSRFEPERPFRRIIFLIITAILLTPAIAFPQQKIHQNLGVEHGLVQSQVLCMHQDRDGYLWLGTLDGVSRWDGIQFHNIQTPDGLAAAQVFAIAEDKDGTLYFGTGGGGVSIYQDGEFTTLDKTHGLANNQIRALHVGRDGSLYIGTFGGGVNVWRNGHIVDHLNKQRGLGNQSIYTIHQAQNGKLYVGTFGAGVSIFEDGQWVMNLTEADGLPSNFIYDMHERADGRLYFATRGGVAIFENDAIVKILTAADGLVDNFVWSIFESSRGQLYFGTWGSGLSSFDGDTFTTLDTTHGLTNNIVYSIFETSDGTLFFGTDRGISLYRPGRFETYNPRYGLAADVVYAIQQDELGRYYFGTDGGGVSMLTNGALQTLTTRHGLVDNIVMTIERGHDGTLYFGTFQNGVSVYRNGKFVKNLQEKDGLSSPVIWSILEARDGTIYFGTDRGVTIRRGDEFSVLTEKDGLAHNRVYTIYEDRGGTVYFGTRGGISIWQNGHIRQNLTEADGLSANSIYSILERADGTMCFGTWGGGLSLYRAGRFTTLDVTNGLSNNTVYGLVEDVAGRLYATTNNGVNILDFGGDSLSIRVLHSSDGLASDECSQGAAFRDTDGRLWFGTLNGVTAYDPYVDQPDSIPPKVHLTRMRLFESDIAFSPDALRKPFKHSENYFKFDFIGIDLSAPQKVVYQYRLSGIDRDWVETTQRFVQYTNLDDGDYTFEVKAKNEWGVWSDPASLSFAISPPYWETWWFRLLALLLVAGALWLFYHIRVNRLLEIERMRVRIASDLHDDIGSTLTRISVSSEIIQASSNPDKVQSAARKIGVLSREVVQTFSDIVWSIDARNDTVGDLLARMQEFAFQIFTPREIHYTFNKIGLEAEKPLPVDLRQNIYLIFKEAINNIAKHSGASMVAIELKNSGGHFRMTITDNGQGFSETQKGTGHGLRNMAMRAERINGHLTLDDRDGLAVILEIRAL